MQPSEFWGCDTWSLMDAYEGYAQSKGVKLESETRLTTDEIEELKQWMDEVDGRRR